MEPEAKGFMQNLGEQANGVFGWLRENKDVLEEGVGFIRGIIGKKGGAPAATPYILGRVEQIMESDALDTGFTFTVPEERLALVVTGPSSSGAEFIDTFVHEVHHLAVAIAKGLGYDLDSEGPAYLAGDAARAFADVVCRLGCDRCHPAVFP